MDDTEKPPRWGWLVPWVVFGGVLGAWLLWLFFGQIFAAYFGNATGLEAAGQFGDLFGAINALFTALAFGAVIWSATLQRQEMEMQRKELALQRKAVEDQRAELEEQRKVFAQQAFESTFFQMLRQCRELGEQFEVGSATGDQAWYAIREVIHDRLGPYLFAATEMPDAKLTSLVGDYYERETYLGHSSQLGPYFRSLYHLYRLIDSQDGFAEANRFKYAQMARAQLSDNQLYVLAVNCCSGPGQGFRKYIAKFGLLKHLRRPKKDHVLSAIRRCYDAKSFAEPEAGNES